MRVYQPCMRRRIELHQSSDSWPDKQRPLHALNAGHNPLGTLPKEDGVGTKVFCFVSALWWIELLTMNDVFD